MESVFRLVIPDFLYFGEGDSFVKNDFRKAILFQSFCMCLRLAVIFCLSVDKCGICVKAKYAKKSFKQISKTVSETSPFRRN